MRSLKTKANLICALLLVLGLVGPASYATAAAPTRPYFKVFGSSVFVGGAFSTQNSSGCKVSTYQRSNFSGSTTNGGILAFIRNTSGLGASTQYESYSTGPIDDRAANYGFDSNNTKNSLTFANFSTQWSSWGGYFDGTQDQSDCVPDYFDNNQQSPAAPSTCAAFTALPKANTSTDIVSLGCMSNGQYLYNNDVDISVSAGFNPLLPNPNQVKNGERITIFVKGNVRISSDISYNTYSLTVKNNTNPVTYDDSQVPKFTLVVQGNINIDPGVTQLDGLYIAQPNNPSDQVNGQISTCYDPNPGDTVGGPVWSLWIVQNCASKLTFNGAVIARETDLLRTKGDVKTAAENNLANSYASANISELFNYNPNIVLVGGGFFNKSTTTYHVDSLISLPPIF